MGRVTPGPLCAVSHKSLLLSPGGDYIVDNNPRKGAVMHSYLVTLSNDDGDIQKIVVQTPLNCIHDMQEFVDGLTDLQIHSPIVIDIDAEAAQHVPIKETS